MLASHFLNQFIIFVFNYILLIMLLQLPQFFPLCSPPPGTPLLSSNHTPQFMSMDRAYKFFGFSISHTILNIRCLFWTYHLCFLFPVPFPPFSLLHLPTDNPPCDLYFCESVSVLLVCLVYFCFCFCFYRFGCW